MSLQNGPPHDGRILLVDDSPDDQTLTIRALRRVGISGEITLARDGAEALALLLPAGGGPNVLPQIVLLDLKLPKVQGLEVLEKIRGNPSTRDLRVIVLSSSDEESDILASSWSRWTAPRKPPRQET